VELIDLQAAEKVKAVGWSVRHARGRVASTRSRRRRGSGAPKREPRAAREGSDPHRVVRRMHLCDAMSWTNQQSQEIELGPQGSQKYPATKLRVGDLGKSLPGLASFSPMSGASSACCSPRAVAAYQPPLPRLDAPRPSRSAWAIASLRFEYRYFP
jgi:hypothetical protein